MTEYLACPVCHDFIVLGPEDDTIAVPDRAWFEARHRHETSDEPPSLQPKPRRKR